MKQIFILHHRTHLVFFITIIIIHIQKISNRKLFQITQDDDLVIETFETDLPMT